MISFKAVGVTVEQSAEVGKFTAVVAFKQVVTDASGLTESELSRQRFTVADEAELTLECQKVLDALKAKQEHADRTVAIVDKVLGETTVATVKTPTTGGTK